MKKLKEDFLKRMKELLNGEYEQFVESFSLPIKRGLVINNLKVDKNIFLRECGYNLKPLIFDENCFEMLGNEKVGSDIFHHCGAFYMQEPSAMLPGLVLPVKKGDVVLDVCAAPGGKTFQIAKRLDGTLFSNEIDFSRAKVLSSNIERLGLKNVLVGNFDSKELSKFFPNKFDAVIVDAPCSGEGMFKREDKAVEQWSNDYVKVCANRQLEILTNVDKTLKENGYLLYSTCTFSIEENEEIVSKLVDLGYTIIDVGEIPNSSNGIKVEGYETEKCKRFYPHKNGGEGQFLCLLKKVNSEIPSYKKEKPIQKLTSNEFKIIESFLKQNLLDCENFKLPNLIKKNDAVFYCPNIQIAFDHPKILSYGVKLGVLTNNRFEPSHNLFTAFGEYFKLKIELDKDNAQKYLSGQTIETDLTNGWCVLNFNNCSLGGGKIVNGVIKNHYPKGLRTNQNI